MIKSVVYNQTGEKISEMDLNPRVFGLAAPPAGRASLSKAEREKLINLVHFTVRAQQANRRSAIAHTKNRGEVSGGGKKPWRQKGTGRARAGSIRSPLWRGGGVTFGPRSERNYAIKVNRPVFRKAVFTVLSDKLKEGKLVIVDNFNLTAPKTKDLVKQISEFIKKTRLGKKVALIIPKEQPAVERAARNAANILVLVASRLNIMDLLKYDLVITKEAIGVIEKTYLPAGRQV